MWFPKKIKKFDRWFTVNNADLFLKNSIKQR
jgi:hypothetical protein